MAGEEETRAQLARIEATVLQMSSAMAQMSAAIMQLSVGLSVVTTQPKQPSKRQATAEKPEVATTRLAPKLTKENAPHIVGYVHEIDEERKASNGQPFRRAVLLQGKECVPVTVFNEDLEAAIPVFEQCHAEGRRVCVWYESRGKYKNYVAVEPMPEAPEPERIEEEPPF